MKKRRTPALPATAEEEILIAQLTAESGFERLDRGESEIVDPDDWSDVPELPDTETLTLPGDLYRQLQAASKKRGTTPEKLAAELIREVLSTK